MSELIAADLCRDLIAVAKNQYRSGNYEGSLATLMRCKDIYRDAWSPLPDTFNSVVAMVQKAIDMEKLKNW